MAFSSKNIFFVPDYTLFYIYPMQKERNRADEYRKAAYEGDPKAMNNLGVCYRRGTGVVQSLELAFQWYMKAALLGDVYGIFNVAECYFKGEGVEKDLTKAFEWYLKAAEDKKRKKNASESEDCH